MKLKNTAEPQAPKKSLAKPKTFWGRFRMEMGYHLLILPALIFVFIFCYIPMGGIVIAFKDFNIRVGIWESPWNGFDNFKTLFLDPTLPKVIVNTLGIGFLNIIVSYPVVIGFALLLNEVKNLLFKRVVQTISYLPHFVAWTVMAIILRAMFDASDGVLNSLFMELGLIDKPMNVLTSRDAFWGLAVWSSVWKELGWSAILYLATMAGIDSSLYEAAEIDGAGRFAKMWYITLPHLKGIIAIGLIMTAGSILGTGFDTAYYLGNAMNADKSATLSYFIWQKGLSAGKHAQATALGLILSVIGATLTTICNTASKKLSGRGLY